jgi:hypothetical protein
MRNTLISLKVLRSFPREIFVGAKEDNGHDQAPLSSDHVRHLHVVPDNLRSVRSPLAGLPGPQGARTSVGSLSLLHSAERRQFIYGLVASMIYGWIVAIIFVFFFNLWPQLIAAVPGQRAIRT